VKELKIILIIWSVLLVSCQRQSDSPVQLTFDPKNHELADEFAFSPDSRWLFYRTRSGKMNSPDSFSIEKIEIRTGKKEILYQASQLPEQLPEQFETVNYLPSSNEILFTSPVPLASGEIHYTGALIKADQLNSAPAFADARDQEPPFTSGALQASTLEHQPGGPNGRWVAFSYFDFNRFKWNPDEEMSLSGQTIGLTDLSQPVTVQNQNSKFCWSGAGFSRLLVKVVPNPGNKTNEIRRAYGARWIGNNEFSSTNGQQAYRLAFLGELASGQSEIFIVEIPEEWSTRDLKKSPDFSRQLSSGTRQRRLTFTRSGCRGEICSNPAGNLICFRSRDILKIWQLFLISPFGNDLIQLTTELSDVQPSIAWHPRAERVFYISDNQIRVIHSQINAPNFGHSRLFTEATVANPQKVAVSPDGKYLAYNGEVNGYLQIFLIPIPDSLW